MTRLLLLVAVVAGCTSDEDLIARCHQFGYYAVAKPNRLHVYCCSKVNGDDICINANGVTRHRRETGQ